MFEHYDYFWNGPRSKGHQVQIFLSSKFAKVKPDCLLGANDFI